MICEAVFQIQSNFGNVKKLYEIVDSFYKLSNVQEKTEVPTKSLADMCWDIQKLGTGITVQ